MRKFAENVDMNRQQLIEETFQQVNKLPDDKIQEINHFAEFLLSKIDDIILAGGIAEMASKSKAFDLLNEEEDLYTVNDATENYQTKNPNINITLSLKRNTLARAEHYAEKHNTNLNALIERYLQTFFEKEKKEIEITPRVKKLSGIIELEDEVDIKEAYRKHLIEKYK
jgi:hypothetical protein